MSKRLLRLSELAGHWRPSRFAPWKRFTALSFLIVLLMFGFVHLVVNRSLASLEAAQLRLRADSLTALKNKIATKAIPPPDYDLRASIGKRFINNILSLSKDVEIPLQWGTVVLKFDRMEIKLEDGIPIVDVVAKLIHKSSGLAAGVRGVGLLAVSTEDAGGPALVLRPRVESLGADITWKNLGLKLPQILLAYMTITVDDLAQRIPVMRVPLDRELKVDHPATQKDVDIPITDGPIKIQLNLPETRISRVLSITTVAVLTDSISIFANIR